PTRTRTLSQTLRGADSSTAHATASRGGVQPVNHTQFDGSAREARPLGTGATSWAKNPLDACRLSRFSPPTFRPARISISPEIPGRHASRPSFSSLLPGWDEPGYR